MAVLLTNNARSLLAASITSSEGDLRVRVGHGDRFPMPKVAGDWFPLTLEDESGNIEIMRATARNGDTITVERGSEGTIARAFNSGDAVELRATAAVFAAISAGGGGADDGVVSVSISDGSPG